MLRLAGGVAATMAGGTALAASAGCRANPADRSTTVGDPVGDVLVVAVAGGKLAAVDAVSGATVSKAGQAVLTMDGGRLVRAEPADSGTRLISQRLNDGKLFDDSTLSDRLAVRAASPNGTLIALATPSGPSSDPYRPGARERTTIVVADSSGQRNRLELPGNLEPEAFDASGELLFVLDYLPPTAPDRYRVRAVNLASGKLEPLLTRQKSVVPPGAEEEMRGEGRQAVYNWHNQQLCTLYTHQPEHLHTRDLVRGARPDAPHVHAFVHMLNLRERWAFCIDLPAPFGEQAAAGHAIAINPSGGRLYVVDAASGAVAVIDPLDLSVVATHRFTPPAASAQPAAVTVGAANTLLVGAGREVVSLAAEGTGPVTRWSVPDEVRGIFSLPDSDQLYVGQSDAVLSLDPTTGAVRERVAVPGLVGLRQVIARA